MRVIAALSLIAIGLLGAPPRHAWSAQAPGPGIPLAGAADIFAQAQAICDRDQGRFWGRPLCGPILLVDPDSRAVVANQADPKGVLVRQGMVFTGLLPPSEAISNSPMPWSGATWTELIWPLLPTDEATRHVMLAHEMFHRIQPGLGLVREGGVNSHLDTLQGRYLLQLEWRALARALQADQPGARLRAVEDALAFRDERYRLFPGAADSERALEFAEGVPEYTGVRLGLVGSQAQRDYAVADLTRHVDDPTFVRSFAYATGPAYGLLLDHYAPDWRAHMSASKGLDVLLRAALPANAAATSVSLSERAASYGGPALYASEVTRDEKRQALLADLRARLVTGPVLHLPAHKINYEFNPSTLQPLGDQGTVFPHIRAAGAFGVLTANNGALIDKDFTVLTVSVAGADLKALKGDGWTLTLNPGWTLKPDVRAGDWRVVAPTPQP
jgi:hypothetical protein